MPADVFAMGALFGVLGGGILAFLGLSARAALRRKCPVCSGPCTEDGYAKPWGGDRWS